ncbi:hypothetical protein [Ralstonia sp. GX3-BWBA]|uniref:hypothetical protein n=1 Tax=Ralstonia sp. GX3-BWBA TaxID=2219865 RepID=UPI000DD49224|nr:hypothetical protein [Ralstonia sp. GX3-BWBA]
MNPILIAALAIALGGGAVLLRKSRRRNNLRALASRESLSDIEIYKQFYAGDKFDEAAVRSVWNEIAETLRVPADKLRPTDKFGADVGAWSITSEELDTLGELAAKRAALQGKEVDIASLATVDDYVRAFAANAVHG